MAIYAKVWSLKASKVSVNPRQLNSSNSANTEHMNPSCITKISANKQKSWFFGLLYQTTRDRAKCKNTSFVTYFMFIFSIFFSEPWLITVATGISKPKRKLFVVDRPCENRTCNIVCFFHGYRKYIIITKVEENKTWNIMFGFLS